MEIFLQCDALAWLKGLVSLLLHSTSEFRAGKGKFVHVETLSMLQNYVSVTLVCNMIRALKSTETF